MRRIGVTAAVLVATLALGLPAAADTSPAGGANNVVIATTIASAMLSQRSGLQVGIDAAPTAASGNLALARATDCTGCRSVAVALQAVLITGSANVITPTNAATAVNSGCTGCTSYAYAFQYVVQTNGPVHLTPAGVTEVAALRSQAADVASSGESPDQLTTDLNALAAQLEAVIDSQVVAAGVTATANAQRDVQAAG